MPLQPGHPACKVLHGDPAWLTGKSHISNRALPPARDSLWRLGSMGLPYCGVSGSTLRRQRQSEASRTVFAGSGNRSTVGPARGRCDGGSSMPCHGHLWSQPAGVGGTSDLSRRWQWEPGQGRAGLHGKTQTAGQAWGRCCWARWICKCSGWWGVWRV